MAIQTVAPIPVPYFANVANGPPSFSNSFVIDAADEKAGAVLRAPKTGNISHLLFRTGTHTTGATLDIRLETVDATTGFPSGTLFGTNTNGSQTTAAANTIYRVALTASASVTRGDIMAMVVANPGTSFGNMAISSVSAAYPNSGLPYCLLYTTSWAASVATYCFGFEYDDGSYAFIPGIFPTTALNMATYNSGTNPNHRGLRFQFAVPVQVYGFWGLIDLDGDADVILAADNWDGTNGNALALVSLDKDIRGSTAGRDFWVPFSSDVTLSANTTYRLIVKPTSVTNLSIFTQTVGDAARWNQTDGGTQFYYSTANNPNSSGSWTDTTTERPFMGLLLNGFQDGAGSGSTVYTLAMQ